ncbi:hypothetical protein GIB67_035396, partial [Kingdonia uniflora]
MEARISSSLAKQNSKTTIGATHTYVKLHSRPNVLVSPTKASKFKWMPWWLHCCL